MVIEFRAVKHPEGEEPPPFCFPAPFFLGPMLLFRKRVIWTTSAPSHEAGSDLKGELHDSRITPKKIQ